jgi:hypothetical protein
MSIATKTKVDLAQLRVREAELAERVEDTRERLSRYSGLIAQARREAVYAGKARPGGELTGPVESLRKKERQDASALPGLEGDLSAVRSVIAEESARLAEAETAEARKRLAELHEQEEGIYQRAGEFFASLADLWNELVEILEEESQVATANRLEAPGILAVEPVPPDFKSFLSLLRVAATDPAVHAAPHVQELTETGIFGRRDEHGNALPGAAYYDTGPVGVQTVEVRRRLDEHDRLFHLIPALGNIVRALQLSGRIPTITAE